MDSKVLSTVMLLGKSTTPPPHMRTASRPSAFQSSLPTTSAEDFSPETSSASTQMAVSESAIKQTITELPLPPFIPYSAQVAWHTGPRALFSHMFPRYGHYCGPNWSSGRNGGSLYWDKPPVDWLDFCCFCHDIGYDTHDQSKLLKADIELLECLRKMPPPTVNPQNGNNSFNQGPNHRNGILAGLYRNLYITGLERFLVPYRRMLQRDAAAVMQEQ